MATKKPMYGYTIADDVDPTLADQSGDKFDTAKLRRGRAQLVETPFLDRKAMRYLGNKEEPNFDVTGAGAGRGIQGGPTAKEMEYRNSESYMSPDTQNKLKEEKRLNKMSAESPSQKYAKGGTASSRADGIAQRGKTRGKMC